VVRPSLFARIAGLVNDDPKAPCDLSSNPRHLEKYGRDRQSAGVPRGSLGAFLAFVERRATATKPGNEVMEAAAKSGSTDQYGKVIASPQALKSDFSTSTMP
jgi:hypothetical protein